eukprot:5341398-Ditylum_brightwellii.AAC.2
MKKGKKASDILMADCLHLKKYWGYMQKQNQGKTIGEMTEAAKAPADHLLTCMIIAGHGANKNYLP